MIALAWMHQQQELSSLLNQLLQSLIDVDVANLKIKHTLLNLEAPLAHLVGARKSDKIINHLEKYVSDAKLVCESPLDQKKQRSWTASLTRMIKQFDLNTPQHGELVLLWHTYHIAAHACMKLRQERNFFDECAAYHHAGKLSEHISDKLSHALVNARMKELCA